MLREPCELPPRIAMLTYVDLGEGAAIEPAVRPAVKAIRGTRPCPIRSRSGRRTLTPVVRLQSLLRYLTALAPAPEFNTAAVRELLMAAFNDEELTTFCFDNFRAVYDDLRPA